jgi:DNA-binding protein HU-beta
MARQITTTKSAAKSKAPPVAQAAPMIPPKAKPRAAPKPATAKEPKKAPAKAAAAVPVAAPAKPAAPATVTLKHLAASLAERHDMQKREAEAVVADVFGKVVDHLKAGERVRIGGLGIIEVKDRPARMGRNPATGEAVQIKASRKVAFRASKDLKDAI